MTRRICLCLMLLVAGVAVAQPAADSNRFVLRFGGGVTVPSGDALDGLDESYTVESSLGVRLDRRLVVGVMIARDEFGLPDDDTVNADFDLTRLGGFVRSYVGDGHKRFYGTVLAANCWERLSASGGGMSIELKDDDFCLSGGVGLQVKGVRDRNLYVEALYHRVFAEDDDPHYFTVALGADIGFGF